MKTIDKRGDRRSLQGLVKSNLADKTITIEVTRTVKHPRYSKYVKKNARYHAHDELNQCDIGDTVLIVEGKVYSKLKKWRLQKIIEKAAR